MADEEGLEAPIADGHAAHHRWRFLWWRRILVAAATGFLVIFGLVLVATWPRGPAQPAPAPTPSRPGTVLGADLASADLWDFSEAQGPSLYRRLPDSCFEDPRCSSERKAEVSDHRSTEQLSDSLAVRFGVGPRFLRRTLSILFEGASGSVQHAEERRYFLYREYVRSGCGPELVPECRYNRSLLSPTVATTLERLLREAPIKNGDGRVLQTWENELLPLTGTHVQIGTERGAELSLLVSSQVVTDTTGVCFSLNICGLASKFLRDLPFGLSCNADLCRSTQSTVSDVHLECAFRGGDPSLAFTCSPDSWTNKSRERFLLSGDAGRPESTFRRRWEEVPTVLAKMGWTEAAHATEMLSKFLSCRGEGRLWRENAAGEFQCDCTLQCVHGKLQEDTCTCACTGDEWHGWTGPTCAETYGKCRAGKGSGNIPLGHACTSGNECSCEFASATCGATDVCCLTDFSAQCCKFGSTCDCGAFSCACVDGVSAANLTLYAI